MKDVVACQACGLAGDGVTYDYCNQRFYGLLCRNAHNELLHWGCACLSSHSMTKHLVHVIAGSFAKRG